MTKPSIEIEFGPDGSIAIEGKDFKGADCEEATAYLEHALGARSKHRRKSDYYHSKSKPKSRQQLGGPQ